MNAVRKNKLNAWRKTYGKSFLQRSGVDCVFGGVAFKVLATECTVGFSKVLPRMGSVNSSFGGASAKAAAAAECIVNFSRAVGDAGHEMNKGFI